MATDIASKGLDFPNITHVINYDMTEDIENYGKKLEVQLEHLSYTYFVLPNGDGNFRTEGCIQIYTLALPCLTVLFLQPNDNNPQSSMFFFVFIFYVLLCFHLCFLCF